jgi:hypothetical protein
LSSASADALQRARRDQHRGRARGAARERRQCEQHEAGDVQAPRAEAVAERAARQHQYRERKRVRIDDPLQAGDRQVQVAGEMRERDVDDRHVELRHDETGADGRDDAGERGREGCRGGGRIHASIVGRDRHAMFQRDVKRRNAGCEAGGAKRERNRLRPGRRDRDLSKNRATTCRCARSARAGGCVQCRSPRQRPGATPKRFVNAWVNVL